MRVPYGTEVILFTSETDIMLLSRGVWYFLGCESVISADMVVESESIQFRIDSGNPTSAHCQHYLEYYTTGYQGDSITFENYAEIAGFRGVKATSHNTKISIIYYKEE